MIDPELRRSIVELGMVRSIEISEDGRVDVMVSLTTPGCPIRSHFQKAVTQRCRQLEGVTRVSVGFDVLSAEEKQGLQQKLGRNRLPEGALAQVKNVICVASGKGGVGKSTVTANLAAALRAEGTRPARSTPTSGATASRACSGWAAARGSRSSARSSRSRPRGGVKVMSIGFFVEDDAAVVWRGPMLHKAIQQFLEDVDWGALDYLLIDLPPGTGDVSMTLAQLLPQAKIAAGHHAAARRPEGRAPRRRDGRASSTSRSLGVVENMSGFTTPDGQRFTIFGEGGGQLLADEHRRAAAGQDPAPGGAARAAPTRARRWSRRIRTHRPRRRSSSWPAASWPRRRSELPVVQAPAMAAAPGFGGKELPVIQ